MLKVPTLPSYLNKYITGNRDTDALVLSYLDKNSLEAACIVNTYLAKICEDGIPWRHKISREFPMLNNEELLKYKRDRSWKKYHSYLVAVKNDDPNRYLPIAADAGQIDSVKILLNDPRASPTAINRSLHKASYKGYSEIVKLLLKDERTDPSFNNNYALRSAIQYGDIEIVKLLLDNKRLDPSVRYNNPLNTAILYGQTEIVKLLLDDKRIDPSAHTDHALRYAIESRNLDMYELVRSDPRFHTHI